MSWRCQISRSPLYLMQQPEPLPGHISRPLPDRLCDEANRAKKTFQHAFRTIVHDGISQEVAEAAFPSYAHRNPLITWVFGGRLLRAYRLFPTQAASLLDFSCGSGIC